MARMYICIEYDGSATTIYNAVNRALDDGTLQDSVADHVEVFDAPDYAAVTSVVLLPRDLTEIALSMQHHDNPRVRSYGAELDDALGGK